MNVEPSRQTKKIKPRASKSTTAKAAAPTATRTRQPVSPCDDPHVLIAKCAYELCSERGYRLDAERKIPSQLPPL